MVGVEQDVGTSRQREQARVVDDYQGHHQRAGQDGDVRGNAAGHQDHARDLLRRKAQQLRRKEFPRHHDAAAAAERFGLRSGEVEQQAGDHVAHIVGLLAHEADGTGLETAQVAVRHLQHGARHRRALVDHRLDAGGESGILQDKQVGGEDQRRHVGQPLADLRLHLLQLLLGGAQGAAEVVQGQAGRVIGRGERVVLALAVQDQARPARQPVGRSLPLEGCLDVGRQRVFSLARQRAGTEQQAGVLDGAGELRPDRAQPLHLHAREAPVLAALHHQHANAGDAARQRYRQEGFELLFPEAGNVPVERALAGHRLVDVAQFLERGAGKPLAELQPHGAEQVAVQTFGGGHGELAVGRVVQVDGAHVGAHVLGNHARGPVQERAQIHRLVKQRA